MKVLSTTQVGNIHEKCQLPCQDVTKIYNGEDFTIMALSDGAGSKVLALESAELVTYETINYFKQFLSEYTIDEFDSSEFTDYIQQCCNSKDYTTENAGATLIFAVIISKQYLIGHIGDGIAIVGNADEFSVVSFPENGVFANETYFFPGENPHEHFRITRGTLGDTSSILLTSDGISDFLYDFNTGETANAVRLMVSWAREYPEDKCISVLQNNFRSIFSEYSGDDKSVAIACF